MFCLGCFPQPMLLPELVTEHQMPPCRCQFSSSAWLSLSHLACDTRGPTRLLLCVFARALELLGAVREKPGCCGWLLSEGSVPKNAVLRHNVCI